MHQHPYARFQQGLTLVEMMVALVIGMLVLTGVVQMFIANKETYRAQDGLARVQETGRFAVYLLATDIAGGGNLGCAGRNHTPVYSVAVDVPDELSLDSSGRMTTLDGKNDVGASVTLPSGTTITPVAGTDMINVRGISTNTGLRYPSGAMADTSSAISLGYGNLTINEMDLLYIADCEKANIFRASNAVSAASAGPLAHATTAATLVTEGSAQAANSSAALTDAFGEDAVIGRLRSYWYYIKLSDETWEGQRVYSLRRVDQDGLDSELVNGIEDMQIVYGVNDDDDDDDTAERYLTANNVTDWENVISVRVNLLVNSVSRAGRAAIPYFYSPDGTGAITPTDATDHRLRREFTFASTLRNHTR